MSPDQLGALLGQAAVPALGRAILHSFWQVTLVAGLTALALATLRRSTSNIRYLVACAGLVVALALPVVTLLAIERPGTAGEAASTAAMTASGSSPVRNGAVAAARAASVPRAVQDPRGSRLDATMPWLVSAWAIGVLLLSLRLLGGWWTVARLPGKASAAPREQWREMFDRTRARLRVTRPVRLLESAAVTVPTVIGWLRPIVLLPVSAMSGLTPSQVEAILAHELAHVRRHDYLVNLLQSAIETLLFYHPAVWWLSARIRREREHCCDDAAVALLGDAIAYGRALTVLEARRLRAPRLAAAVNGGPLMRRIARLRETAGRPSTQPGWLLPVFVVLIVLLALASATAVRAAHATDTRINAGSIEQVAAGDRPAFHVVTRRMTVLEALVWRLPASLRRDLVALGLVAPVIQPRNVFINRLSLWDRLLPLVVEFTPASGGAHTALLPPVVVTAPQDSSQPVADQDLQAELERMRATLRQQLERVDADLQRALPRETGERTRVVRDAVRRALEETRRAQRQQRAEMDRALREYSRGRTANSRADLERALAEAQQAIHEQIEKMNETLRQQLDEALRQQADSAELGRARAVWQREMERVQRQLREQIRDLPRLSRMPRMQVPRDLLPPPAPAAPPAVPDAPAAAAPPALPLPPVAQSTLPPPPAPPAPPPHPAAPAVPAPPAPPALPALPVPPVPPSPPAVPAPPAPPQSGLLPWLLGHQNDWAWSSSTNGRKIEVRGVGRMSDIMLTDDETDIRSLPPGGWLTITESTGLFGRVTFEARSVDGKLQRKWSGLEGETQRRKWLADRLLELVRNSGLAADSRVARILKQSGADGVLREISRITSDHVKRIYFQRLLATASLDGATLSRLIEQAGREMRSAYEMAALLTNSVAPRLGANDDSTRRAYVQAVGSISSDYERRRALEALINAGHLGAGIVAQVIDAAGALRSDYEKGRVLSALANDQKIDGPILVALVQATARIGSSYERARVLSAIARQHPLQGAAREAYLAAARSIPSRHEQDRALAALTRAEVR